MNTTTQPGPLEVRLSDQLGQGSEVRPLVERLRAVLREDKAELEMLQGIAGAAG